MIRRRREATQRRSPGARASGRRTTRARRSGAALIALTLAAAAAPTLPPGASAAPRARGASIVTSGIVGAVTRARGPIPAPGGTPGAPGTRTPGRAHEVIASHPQQIATFPHQGQTHVAQRTILYFVFDQPTLKSGSFSVADIDSMSGLVPLGVPRWSALGDTVFLTPLQPLALGHLHGMRVNTIFATDSTASNDLPIIYFRVTARANIVPIAPGSLNQTLLLAAEVPTPVGVSVRETAGTAAAFTSVRVDILASAVAPPGTLQPIQSILRPVDIRVPRLGIARLETPITLSPRTARLAAGGHIGIRIRFDGTDETESPFSFEFSQQVVVAGDTLDQFKSAAIVPDIAAGAVIQSAVLETPLDGAAIAAGDTLLARAVVTGTGTGPFRGSFTLDGEVFAIEEGYLEAGRPAVLTPRGPLPTRRLGEHRLQFTVESPQVVAARPITFLCVPPEHGVSRRPGEPSAAQAEAGAAPAPAAAQRLAVSGTLLADGRTKLGPDEASAVAWGMGTARYDVGAGATLEASTSLRLRADDPSNGSARPEQVRVKLSSKEGALEWSDAAPTLASNAPLFASAVPRRAAQARWEQASVGTLEGYVALNSRPGGSGGLVDQPRSDLYAARFTRALGGGRAELGAYGGYTHEDPTPGGAETLVRARSIVGGMGRVRLAGDWTLVADAASVHHREASPDTAAQAADPTLAAHTRAGWRGQLSGTLAGVSAIFQGFRYQPDLATALNPYALSNRVGGSADLSRAILKWRLFAGFRSEQPAERVGQVPNVRVDNLRVGGRLTLNQCSWVEPAIVYVTHRGANTEYKESRFQTSFTRCEQGGGQTTVRLDGATYRDDLAANAKRRVLSGSLVSSLRHATGATSTISLGYEENTNRGLDITDTTIEGTFETRFEAVPGRLVVVPAFAGSSRDYQTQGTKETRLGGRLQIALLRFAGLGENALALTGRLDHRKEQLPADTSHTEGSVELTWGQRFDW